MPGPTNTIEAALFEGMFVRAMRPDAPFVAELKELGFDLNRMQARYPVEVWRKALEVARRRLFGERPEERGYRALGDLFVQGYFETIIGKILAVPLSLVSPERVIQRLPKSWQTARSDIRVEPPVQEGPQRWRVRFHDSNPLPGFFAGIVEGASRRTRMKKQATVDIERVEGQGFDLVIHW
jgi:uncharacterized protein (TIGR02265 family)